MPENEKEVLLPTKLTKAQTEVLGSLWKLYFKRGFNPRAELVFAFNGSKDEAINRGRRFCIFMNYKFIHVEPFFVDLDDTEKHYKNEDRPVQVHITRSA
jgi:hypothetical protein